MSGYNQFGGICGYPPMTGRHCCHRMVVLDMLNVAMRFATRAQLRIVLDKILIIPLLRIIGICPTLPE